MKKRAIRNTLVALSLAASAAAALPAEAAVPTTLTHQGRLYDQSNTPVVGSIDVLFAIYDSLNASVPLWSEQQTLTFDAGYYSAALGSVVPFPAGLFTGGQLYFGVTFGTDPEMTPRSLMGSVPFALVAGDVTGDIHPTTISISGVGTVIDAAGNWVGSPTGLQGPMGPMGPAGANGLDGAQGPMGPAGPMGPMGPAGANGLDGAQGPMGPAGPMGPTGPAGANGANGAQGPMGPAGPMGPMGPAGANGLDGAQGPMGPAGATGAAGPAGAAGATGATGATGSVNAASFLTLTPQSVAPANPAAGTVYFNSTDNTLRYFTGSAWQTLGNSSAGGGPEHALPAGLSSSDILNHLTLDSTVADTGLNAAGTSLVGSLSWIPGAFGTAGSGFSVSNAVALTKLSFSSYTATGLTFTAWVKGTDTHATASDYQVANNIFGDTTGSVWLGAGVASGKAAIRGGSTEVQSSLSVADGNWHHIGFVLTYSGGAWNVVIYVDGVASGSGALTAGGNPNYAINTIGRTYTGYTQYFGYAIDSVYLFNKSISAAQMSSLAAP